MSYNSGLHKDLFSRATTQESDSGPASTASCTDRRNAHFSSLIKSAISVFYVYLVYLVCYLPLMISVKGPQIFGQSVAVKTFLLFSLTLLFLNSSLNPVIYCWKMRPIRHAVMNILRNMSSLRNRASQ